MPQRPPFGDDEEPTRTLDPKPLLEAALRPHAPEAMPGGLAPIGRSGLPSLAEEDSDLMHYLQTNLLTPGTRFEVTDRAESYGITLRRDGQMITLSPQIASQLWGDENPA